MERAQDDEQIPLDAILGFLSATAAEIAQRIARLEEHAAGTLATGATADPTRFVAIQDLDLIRQMAEDAARVAATAREPRGRRRGVLAADLRLAALRDRLLCPEGAAPAMREAAGPGPVELFSAALSSDRTPDMTSRKNAPLSRRSTARARPQAAK